MTTTRPTFEDLLGWLEASRANGQVHFDDRQQCWHVLGHPEVVAVLSDPAVFSSDLSALRPAQDDLALFQRGNFVNMDPPQHRKLRTLGQPGVHAEGRGGPRAADRRADHRAARPRPVSGST